MLASSTNFESNGLATSKKNGITRQQKIFKKYLCLKKKFTFLKKEYTTILDNWELLN